MGSLKSFAAGVWIILQLFVALPAWGQDQLQRAFQESYRLEAGGDYRQAAGVLREAYQSDSYEMNLRLGWLYYQAGAMGESIEHYQRAIALKPYGIEARFGLALPYSAMGRWDDVSDIYRRILETDPQNTVASYRLGLILYNNGQYDRAEPLLEKVVNLYPFDYDSLLLFAWIKFRLGKTREARILFNKVLLHTPEDPSALEGLSLIK
ncbi:MAG: tetratricopeptide repeat protein [Bacteroidales bacterium]